MRLAILVSVAALAACSSPGGGNGGTASGGGTTTAAAWNAADACALLPREAVAQAVGRPVTDAQLAVISPGGGGMAMVSTCTYDFGADKSLTLLTRLSPNPDNNDAMFRETREGLADNGRNRIEDVPGLGRHAFYVDGLKQLNVFVGDDRMISLTGMAGPDGVDMKAALMALARRLVV